MFGYKKKLGRYFLFGWSLRAGALVNGLLHDVFDSSADIAIKEMFGVSLERLSMVYNNEGGFSIEDWKFLYDRKLMEKIKVIHANSVEDAMLYVNGAKLSSVSSYKVDEPRLYLPGDVLVCQSEENSEVGLVYSKKGVMVRKVGEILLNI